MNSVETTGKTIEEAVELALTQLGVGADRVEYEVLETPSKGFLGFGSRPAKVKVVVKKVDPVEVAKEFLRNIFAQMDLAVEITEVPSSENVTFNFKGEELGILIGKHGQTLDALQYLTNLAANRDAEERIRIVLDVEDYRKRRAETLNRLALRLADKVRRSGERIALEPMSPHERKIIHMALQNDHRIVTYSEGEEPYRKVVIGPKGR
ncbi:MAG: protein jag [Veillonellaceae bacterium]|jgi:spoIIIJ-associated protein|nr:protein jag [Veillonellaceae bacterium]